MSRLRVYLFTWGSEEPGVDVLVDLARTAEELGYEAVHIPWHFTMPLTGNFPDFGTRYLLDPMVVLPILARETRRIKLAFEFVLPTLHPFVWAQYFASLDAASGGRVLAVPVMGWWDDDFRVGVSRRNQRGRRMDEALAAVTALWEGRDIREAGRFSDCAGLRLNPRPRQNSLPVWIGGGEKSVERAARYATALYPLVPTPEEVKTTWRPALASAAEKLGRKLELAIVSYGLATDDHAWLQRHALPKLLARINALSLADAQRRLEDQTLNRPEDRLMIGTNAQCAERLGQFLDAGADHIVIDFYMHGWEPSTSGKEQMRRFAEEVVPLVARHRG